MDNIQNITNYEKQVQQWEEKFLTLDQAILMEKLPELQSEGTFLTINHFYRKFGINKFTGKIIALSDDLPISCCEKLNIYTLLWYSSPVAHLTNKWVTFSELKGASPFAPAFQTGLILPFARMFSGNTSKLKTSVSALGGSFIGNSDIGFELKAFECIPIRFLFWEGDEEFAAQANILFDTSATDFIHVESIVTIAMVGLAKLANTGEIPIDPSMFPIF
jgi:hypothetical protein